MKSLILSLILLGSTSFADNLRVIKNELLPFTSDGCSKSPDMTWLKCCKEHDVAYWQGGTRDQRLEADKQMRACIADIAGGFVASIYYSGVRVGGGPGFKSSYRWGYGWKYFKNYGPLNDSEIKQVENLMPENLDDIPVTPARNGLSKLPTATGDYCLDEIQDYFYKKNLNQGLDAEIEDVIIIPMRKYKTRVRSSRKYKVKISSCETQYIFDFGKITTAACKKEQRISIHKRFLKEVYIPQNCL